MRSWILCASALFAISLSACQEEPVQKSSEALSLPTIRKALPKAANITVPEGKPMDAFDLPTNDGKRYNIAPSLGKKAFVVYFFATWYDEAAEEIKALEALQKNYTENLEILTVAIDSADSRAKVDEFVIQHNIALPVLLDPNGNLLEKRHTGIAVAPQTLVIDVKGNLVATRSTDEEEEDSLADLLKAILAKQ